LGFGTTSSNNFACGILEVLPPTLERWRNAGNLLEQLAYDNKIINNNLGHRL